MDHVLRYLGLDQSYQPSPTADPVAFLTAHIHHLPSHLLANFSSVTDPKQRTQIPAIRNRRLKYLDSNPPEFAFQISRATWPTLWSGRQRPGEEQGKDEKKWAEESFLAGGTKHVGKLGDLLSGYEQERQAEHARESARLQRANEQFIPEEDSDSDDEVPPNTIEPESEAEMTETFLRTIKERFIYGLLDNVDYNRIDFDETLDTYYDNDSEEKWFEEEEEG